MKNLQKLGYIAIGSILTIAIMGTALAATGSFTITVDPVNIQVNGATFAPKDAKGNDVPVFAYNGTTYAPLRALAEAYGLEVGYDAQSGMAMVGEKGALPQITPTSNAASDKENIQTAQDAVDELKANLKNPNSLILNKVRLFYYNGQTDFYHVEIDYSAMNSFGGYDRSNFYYPLLFNTAGGKLERETASIIDRDGYDFISISIDDLQ